MGNCAFEERVKWIEWVKLGFELMMGCPFFIESDPLRTQLIMLEARLTCEQCNRCQISTIYCQSWSGSDKS